MSAKSIPDEELQSFLYRALLGKIISGEFAPGQRLVEEELARAYGVSRTPIREVLLAFAKDGLVERVRNCGAKVVAFTAEDVEELFDIRKALEIHCIPTVVRTIKMNELLELQHRLEAADGKSGSSLMEEHEIIDLKLHHLIVENSGNRRLIAQMRNLSLLIESLQLTSFVDDDQARKTGEQHLAIVRAVLCQDVGLAQRLLAEHIEYGKRNVLQMFIKSTYEQKLATVE
ncbi:MAG: GntR family transcriptional regulator [Bryobacteraceae bacterium]